MTTEQMIELRDKARKWQALREKSVLGPYTAWPDPEGRTIHSETDGAVSTSCSDPAENKVLAFLDCDLDDEKMEATAELMAASWEMLDAITVLLAATELYVDPPKPAVPAKWKLVPIVPTDAMALAALRTSLSGEPALNGIPQWAAMLAVAPEPPQ